MTKLIGTKLTLMGLAKGNDRAEFIDLELEENKQFLPPNNQKAQGAIIVRDADFNDLVIYVNVCWKDINTRIEERDVSLRIVGVYLLEEITKK